MPSNIYVQTRIQIRVIHVTGVSSNVGLSDAEIYKEGKQQKETLLARIISRPRFPNSATGRIGVERNGSRSLAPDTRCDRLTIESTTYRLLPPTFTIYVTNGLSNVSLQPKRKKKSSNILLHT